MGGTAVTRIGGTVVTRIGGTAVTQTRIGGTASAARWGWGLSAGKASNCPSDALLDSDRRHGGAAQPGPRAVRRPASLADSDRRHSQGASLTRTDPSRPGGPWDSLTDWLQRSSRPAHSGAMCAAVLPEHSMATYAKPLAVAPEAGGMQGARRGALSQRGPDTVSGDGRTQ